MVAIGQQGRTAHTDQPWYNMYMYTLTITDGLSDKILIHVSHFNDKLGPNDTCCYIADQNIRCSAKNGVIREGIM